MKHEIENYLGKSFQFGYEIIKIEREDNELYKENGDFVIEVWDSLKDDFKFFTWVKAVTRYGLHWSSRLLNKHVTGVIHFEELKECVEPKRRGGSK